jgi:hypothetical protein
MEENSIFVGNKPFMNYVTGVVMQFTTKNASEVIIKARGKFISRAVDIAEVAATLSAKLSRHKGNPRGQRGIPEPGRKNSPRKHD